MLKTICVLAAFSIAGCTAGRTVLRVVCPPSLRDYSSQQMLAAADAIRLAKPILQTFMIDYGRLRAELTAAGCRKS